ncbi:MAG: acetyl-CoA carboxylase biotin carboxylase subunit, partial [Albidovulum sp.]|nr:acetyl-CoA carboxylase biotin carboxylase subunit [Albidovulum sp.]
AIARMRRALGELIVDGLDTTAPLFEQVLQEQDFADGNYDIHWLENWLKKQQA